MRIQTSFSSGTALPDAISRQSLVPDPAADWHGELRSCVAAGALHEIHSMASADIAPASLFALGLSQLHAQARPVLWVRQDRLDGERGELYPPGLAALGIDPSALVLVRARDVQNVLQAALEATRCISLGAVIAEVWGDAKALDLTASRRLSLASNTSGVTVFMLRIMAAPNPSAAQTRWHVQARPSRALEANAPGRPQLEVRLVRHRGGFPERQWCVEWNHETRSFEPGSGPASLSRFALPGASNRPVAARA